MIGNERPVVVIQSAICGSVDVQAALKDHDVDLIVFDVSRASGAWASELAHIEAEVVRRPLLGVFCSIEVAERIRRSFPSLSRGLYYRPEMLSVAFTRSLLPHDGVLLNGSFMMLPLSRLQGAREQLRALYGSRLFLRPNSSKKPFHGADVMTDDLDSTVLFLERSGVTGDEIVVVDAFQNLWPVEFRFWVSMGVIVTQASYSLHGGHSDPELAALARSYAEQVLTASPMLEVLDERFVMDVVVVCEPTVVPEALPDMVASGQARFRVVEFNAWSTSGFYPEMSLPEVVFAT